MTALHPAFRLACWLIAIVALQSLAGPALLAALLLPLLGGRAVLARWARLTRRTRWLLLSLTLVMAYSVAGTPLWTDGPPAPTLEGLEEAATQCGRLVLVLGAVAVLLGTTSLPQLMAGCHALLRPLDALGVGSDRIVARLMLTLHYAENLPPPRHWRELLVLPPADGPETVELPRHAVGWRDWLALALTLGFGGVALACGGGA